MKSLITAFITTIFIISAQAQDKSHIKSMILKVYKDIAFKENSTFHLIDLQMKVAHGNDEQKKMLNTDKNIYIVTYEIKAYQKEHNTSKRKNITGRYFIVYDTKYNLLKFDSY